jgi:dTDP-4-amino-4,6-dideoxygalactose transaminase
VWRHVPPAYSPLSLGALSAGFGAGSTEPVASLLRRTFGADAVLMLDSGTSALALALRTAMVKHPGRPVALPAYGCYDLATAADMAGAEVLLYDLDPVTLSPDTASLNAVLARGVAGVVVVHWYGVPLPMPELSTGVAAADALLIEDAAQGTGGSIDGRPLGANGPLSVLSFGRGKGATGGGGGALLGIGPEVAGLVAGVASDLQPAGSATQSLVAAAAQWALARPGMYALPASLPFLRLGETIYHPPHEPRAMPDAQLRVLARVWPLLEREAETRRRNADRLMARCVAPVQPVRPPVGARPGWLRLPLLVPDRAGRLTPEARRLGIMPGYPVPLSTLPGFGSRAANAAATFPGAARLAASLVTLPTHSLLNERDLVRLERWLASRQSAGGGS